MPADPTSTSSGQAFATAAADLFAALGQAATYTPVSGAPLPVQAILDRNATVYGELGQVLENRAQVSLLRAEVTSPRRGDTVVIDAETFTLDNLDPGLSDDWVIVWWVRR